MVDSRQLRDHVASAAQGLDVPGVAVGVHHQGAQQYATHGVTSVENPLPVDEQTLFAIGSIGKTYTATTIMRLVQSGQIDLNERVRAYVPELRLQDERAAEEITVMHLLNHTSGFEGDAIVDTGEGDDALARFVQTLAEARQLAPLGSELSYNNAAVKLAGHVIEKITGQTYEEALTDLVLRPLGLAHTLLRLNDIMTRRFACGHTKHTDDTITVYRPWSFHRSETPAGGRIASSVSDQIAWARFHLGHTTAAGGDRVLSEATLQQMKEPTSESAPSVGIIWGLRELEGTKLVEHGGSQPGQYSMLSMAPEQDFALSVLVNSGPNGQELLSDLVRWALEAYLGIAESIPEPLDAGEEQLAAYVGAYSTDMAMLRVKVSGNRLRFTPELLPEVIEQARAEGQDQIPIPSPFRVGLLPDDQFLVLDGPFKDEQGRFVRESGAITAMHFDRLMPRVSDPVPAG
jgi:CubicO group peptidase (beta-lactamase class C family)